MARRRKLIYGGHQPERSSVRVEPSIYEGMTDTQREKWNREYKAVIQSFTHGKGPATRAQIAEAKRVADERFKQRNPKYYPDLDTGLKLVGKPVPMHVASLKAAGIIARGGQATVRRHGLTRMYEVWVPRAQAQNPRPRKGWAPGELEAARDSVAANQTMDELYSKAMQYGGDAGYRLMKMAVSRGWIEGPNDMRGTLDVADAIYRMDPSKGKRSVHLAEALQYKGKHGLAQVAQGKEWDGKEWREGYDAVPGRNLAGYDSPIAKRARQIIGDVRSENPSQEWQHLTSALSHKPGVTDPSALAAWIEDRKYGKGWRGKHNPWTPIWKLRREDFIEENAEAQRKAGLLSGSAEGMSARRRVMLREDHERVVRKAVAQGLPVPPVVLSDYPDLIAAERKAFQERVEGKHNPLSDRATDAYDFNREGRKEGQRITAATGVQSRVIDRAEIVKAFKIWAQYDGAWMMQDLSPAEKKEAQKAWVNGYVGKHSDGKRNPTGNPTRLVLQAELNLLKAAQDSDHHPVLYPISKFSQAEDKAAEYSTKQGTAYEVFMTQQGYGVAPKYFIDKIRGTKPPAECGKGTGKGTLQACKVFWKTLTKESY